MNTIFEHRQENFMFSLAEGGDGEIFAIVDNKGLRIPLQQEETMLTILCARAIKRQQRAQEEPETDAQAQGMDSEQQSVRPVGRHVTNPETVMREAIVSVLGPWAESLGTGLTALTEAVCAAYGRHQTGEAYGIPAFEPATCGTGHLIAERTLRILGRATVLEGAPTAETAEAIESLVDRAGIAFAREALAADTKVRRFNDDLPF
ncbi:hypothetical protein [Novosphingobium sp. UBA1939]|uniref:hypothetical protein n=1 Tax=Novosphingobium sp. UBA1939 TaxID=1946982 RepID=UPI0025F0D9C6|nr:hypothetical protein [Novosphingobium sp. UBA1939]